MRGANTLPTLDVRTLDEKTQLLFSDAAERYLAAGEAGDIAAAMKKEAQSELLVYMTDDALVGHVVIGGERGWQVSPVAASSRTTINEAALKTALLEAGGGIEIITRCILLASKASQIAATIRVTAKGGTSA
mgnify:FL=1